MIRNTSPYSHVKADGDSVQSRQNRQRDKHSCLNERTYRHTDAKITMTCLMMHQVHAVNEPIPPKKTVKNQSAASDILHPPLRA